MQITLLINNKPKAFIQPFVSGRILRKTIELDKIFKQMLEESGEDYENYDRLKDLDLASEYVAEVFNNQFSPEQYLDGTPSHEVIKTYLRIKTEVETGRNEVLEINTESKEEADPNA